MATLLRRCVAEAIGTFFLVLIGPGAAMVDTWSHAGLGTMGVALAFAFVVIALVAALGHVSGAHINPAVTLGFWSIGRFPRADVLPYISAQLAGAITGSAVLFLTIGNVATLGATLPSVAVTSALAFEFLMSFVLMLVIMGVATDERAAPDIAPLAIGLTVGFCALVGGPLTGASMNPARSFGPALVGGQWRAHWVYWVAPVAGMIAAAHLYQWLRSSGQSVSSALGTEGPI